MCFYRGIQDMMTIKELIELKELTGLTIGQISERSGVPVGTLSKIFAGLTLKPRTVTLLAIERALNDPDLLQQGKAARYHDALPERPRFTDVHSKSESAFWNNDRSPSVVSDDGTHYGPTTNGAVLSDMHPGNTRTEPFDTSVFRGKPARWKHQGEFTVEDYLSLPNDVRVELIDGVFYYMEAPEFIHQILVKEFTLRLDGFVKSRNGTCWVCPSPVDVQLLNDDKTLVQPDVIVVCDRGKIRRRVFGAPDMCIEILSRSTMKKDRRIKSAKYAEAGVREYWIVDPYAAKVTVYRYHDDGDDEISIYGFDAQIPVGIWEDACVINMPEIYEQIRDLFEDD